MMKGAKHQPDENTLSLFLGGWAHTGNYGHVSISLDELAKDIAVFGSPNGVVAMISPVKKYKESEKANVENHDHCGYHGDCGSCIDLAPFSA